MSSPRGGPDRHRRTPDPPLRQSATDTCCTLRVCPRLRRHPILRGRALLEAVFAACNLEHTGRSDDVLGLDVSRLTRSLSVGDVAAIDDRYYACSPWDWYRIDTP
ncbi:hypothetical protein IU487_33620 [Nocardia puris]|uniref:hypothetical protein n=1 Tax=Nocardia puris TaxID=208602 RepID=UPI0011BD4ADE|nr:hypothetical protein [Nocardia puris]MBF6215940.1 hypothetical protein [Nocardia puris]